MKKMKKVFLAVLTIAVIACLFAVCGVTGSAETTTGTYGDLSYSITDGEVTITDCKETATVVEISETIEGYPVTAIGSGAFSKCSNLETVKIGKSVKKIRNHVFSDCSSLMEINIPESVEYVGDGFCMDCPSLTKVEWNAKNIRFGEDGLFLRIGKNGDGVDVVFGNNVEAIPSDMFYDSKLKSVTIGSSVKTIGGYAFNLCVGFNSIELPDSLEVIENGTFSGCSDLETVVIGNSVKTINYGAFIRCTSLKNIIIPESTTYIAQDVFYNTALEKIVINNPKCVIEYSASTIPVDAVIYGYADSPAQMYAQMYGRDFVALAAAACTHSYGEWIIDADASCTQRGFAHRVCALCNGYEFNVIDEKGHTDEDADNCCDVCDAIISAQTPDTGDNSETQTGALSGFLNSITEFFNRIIAWIKSLFGMA